MDLQFQSVVNRASSEAARVFDSAVREVLDKALGPNGWTLADIPRRGELRECPVFIDVLWDGRLLATIHRSQLWGNVNEPTGDPPGRCIRWTLRLRVQMHVEPANA